MSEQQQEQYAKQQQQRQELVSKQHQEQEAKQQPQQQEQTSKEVMEIQQKVADGMIFAGGITVENDAGFVLSYSVTDGQSEVSSDQFPAGEARGVDISGLESHREIRLTVYAAQGLTQEAQERIVFIPEQPTARFRVTGTPQIYNIALLG